jgi:hypothetical protein
MFQRRMLKIIRSKETRQISTVTRIQPKQMKITRNNIIHEASMHCRNKKTEYLKDKINELATNSKNKNIRDCIEKQMN